MSTNHDVFPPSHSAIFTHDPHLTRLLRAVHDKVSERVTKPWPRLQRAVVPVTKAGVRGWTQPQQLIDTLQQFGVVLPMSDILFIWSCFPLPIAPEAFLGGDAAMPVTHGFDWARFVSAMFPSELGEQVVPRYHGPVVNSSAATARRPGEPILHQHPPSRPHAATFFGATGDDADWAQLADGYQDSLDAHRTSMLVYPRDAGAPPASLLLKLQQREDERRAVERRRLDEAFAASRRLSDTNATGTGIAPATAGKSQSLKRSGPMTSVGSQTVRNGRTHASSAASTVAAPLPPPAQPTASRPSHQSNGTSTSAPTYMLPVEKRITATLAQRQALEAAAAKTRKRAPLAPTLGEKVTTWKNDTTYRHPGISFGQAYKL